MSASAEPTLKVAQQTIKMVMFDQATRTWVEVKPWEFECGNPDLLVPMFWSNTHKYWFTVPDENADTVADEWLAQWNG